ncbi:small ribosomal subunit protein uS14m isoform X2 [Narcine bancroftii]|uniref:small ribosomal subunit protein uS14m isoform X2 n=1 Tax=Narcine bancroftii TaxID=1343680 RepID=UPI003831BBC4
MALALVCGQTGRFLRQAGRQLLSLVPRENVGPVRNYYVDWRMLRDVKRRKMAFEYADERRRLNAIRKNTILPKELQLPALEEEDIIDLEAPFTDLEIKTAMLEMPNDITRPRALEPIGGKGVSSHCRSCEALEILPGWKG